MIGYVYETYNTANGKRYIGMNLSVKFDKDLYGSSDDLYADIAKYGKDRFIVRMLRAYEDIKDVNAGYEYWLSSLNALSDPSFYNCKQSSDDTTDSPKRGRRKKSEADE